MFARKSSVVSLVLVTAFFGYGSFGCAAPTSTDGIAEDEASLAVDEMGSSHDAPSLATTGSRDEAKTASPKPVAEKRDREPTIPSYLLDAPVVAERASERVVKAGGAFDATIRNGADDIGDLRGYGDAEPQANRGSDGTARSADPASPSALYGARPVVGDLRNHGYDAPVTARGGDTVRYVGSSSDARIFANGTNEDPELVRRAIPVPRFDGTAASSCYDARPVPEVVGSAPRLGSNRCSESEIAGMAAACLPNAESSACKQLVAANPSCGACVVGAREIEKPTIPVVLSSRHGEVAVVPGACAAMVVGRPECAQPLAAQDACLVAACPSCDGPNQKAACLARAATGICAPKMATACTDAVMTQRAKWEPACMGATVQATFTRVATLFCGK